MACQDKTSLAVDSRQRDCLPVLLCVCVCVYSKPVNWDVTIENKVFSFLILSMSEEQNKVLTGKAARSRLCCQGQADELFHMNETGGKTLDLVQQHEDQHRQAFSAATEVYEM